jgi:hypothetical protein
MNGPQPPRHRATALTTAPLFVAGYLGATGGLLLACAVLLTAGEEAPRFAFSFSPDRSVSGNFTARHDASYDFVIEFRRPAPPANFDPHEGRMPAIDVSVTDAGHPQPISPRHSSSYSTEVGGYFASFEARAGHHYHFTARACEAAPALQRLDPHLEIQLGLVELSREVSDTGFEMLFGLSLYLGGMICLLLYWRRMREETSAARPEIAAASR